MSFTHKVVALFFVSILLQGCQTDPKECEGAEGKDMEVCKKCVESAQKTPDSSEKAVQLKACAQVAKESKKNQPSANNTQKKPSFQQVTENIVGNAAKASLVVASSVVQTSVPIEFSASLRRTGQSVGNARARQKMAERVRSGANEGRNNPYSGIETPRAANTAQVMRGASTSQDNVFNAIESLPAAKTAQVTSGARTGQDNPYSGIDSQQVVNTAQVKSVASAGEDGPYNVIDSEPVVSTAQGRSAASAGQDSPYNVIESQPAMNAAQVDDDVTSGPGNLPNSAESHLQANPVQAITEILHSHGHHLTQGTKHRSKGATKH